MMTMRRMCGERELGDVVEGQLPPSYISGNPRKLGNQSTSKVYS